LTVTTYSPFPKDKVTFSGRTTSLMAQKNHSGNGRLDGKVALLAGATSGIGQVMAEMFAAEGACVIAGGRRRREGEAVAEAISASGGRAAYQPLDVSDEASVEGAVRFAVGEFGRLDVLVSNAGGSSVSDGPVTTASIEEFWNKARVDYFGSFLCSRFAIPEIAKSGGGTVINIASLAGFGTTQGRDAYSSAKGAVLALTRSTAREFARDRVRVNAIAPATVRTERIERLIEASSEARKILEGQALGLIEPSEIAHAATFLASDDARSITGQVIAINGGLFE
jgi:NAD(P)-dependent dehydrogenase (short-subunit alcohol dehydrogenase family)